MRTNLDCFGAGRRVHVDELASMLSRRLALLISQAIASNKLHLGLAVPISGTDHLLACMVHLEARVD